MPEPRANLAVETFQVLVRLMVNLKFAVGLLTFIGLVSIVATVLGGVYSEEVQMAVFTSPFFSSLMMIFTFALALALASRWPWKKTHAGWILTHCGLIVIVFGHLATSRGLVDGHVDLMEGQATSVLEQKDWVITADVPRYGARLTAVLDIDDAPDTPIVVHRPTAFSRALGFFGLAALGEVAGPKVYTLPGGDSMTVERYWPTYGTKTRVTPDFTPGAPPAPAVLLEVRAGKRRLSEWLFADDPDESAKALGDQLQIVHRRFETAAAMDAVLGLGAPPASEAPASGRIAAVEAADDAASSQPAHGGAPHGQAPPKAGRVLAEADLASASGEKPVPLGTTGYTIRIERRFERLAVVDGKPSERADGPPNAAVIAVVTDPSGKQDRRFIFAAHGEIGGSMALPFRLVYTPSGASGASATRLPPSTLAVLEAPGRAPTVVLVEPDGTERRFALSIGAPIPLPWLGAEAAFADRYDRAFASKEPWCQSYAMNRPAVLVTVRAPARAPGRGGAHGMGAGGGSGAAREDTGVKAWVVWSGDDRPAIVEGSQGPIELRLTPRRLPLGFTIQLQDFVLETYEGTENPKSFESFVRVTPHDGQPPFDYHIYMNHPLTYNGVTFFQSSYDPDTLQRSIFAVSKDPGWPVVYLGYALLVLGLSFVVYVKPGIVRREAERLAAEGLRRAAEKKARAEAGVQGLADGAPGDDPDGPGADPDAPGEGAPDGAPTGVPESAPTTGATDRT